MHHAIPINQDWEKRLDDENLITLCAMHHEMSEDGEIPVAEILEIITEQEEKRIPQGSQLNCLEIVQTHGWLTEDKVRQKWDLKKR